MIGPVSRLLTALDTRDYLNQLREILGAEMASPPRKRSKWIWHRQVRPCARQREYRAIGALEPDPITVPAGPLGDTQELLAREGMERVGDPDLCRRRCRVRCN